MPILFCEKPVFRLVNSCDGRKHTSHYNALVERALLHSVETPRNRIADKNHKSIEQRFGVPRTLFLHTTCKQCTLLASPDAHPVLFPSARVWVEQLWEDSYSMPTESGTVKFIQTATIKSWYGDSLRYVRETGAVCEIRLLLRSRCNGFLLLYVPSKCVPSSLCFR